MDLSVGGLIRGPCFALLKWRAYPRGWELMLEEIRYPFRIILLFIPCLLP